MSKLVIKDNWNEMFGANDMAMDRALNRMAIDIERIAKMKVPVKKGQLKSSGHHQKTGNLSYKVYFNKEYAAHVEFGVSAHEIPVGPKGFLAFQIGGNWVYTKKAVQNPGFKGRFYLTDAIKAVISRDIDYIQQEVNNITL